jgi:hypothetical protein
MVFCPGCGGTFAFGSGYLNHVRLSRNTDCVAIYQQSLEYQSDALADSELEAESDIENEDAEPQAAPIILNHDNISDHDFGDAFDEYNLDDYIPDVRPEGDVEDEQEDEPETDEEEFGDNYEEYWEPPPPQSLMDDVDFLDEQLEDDPSSSQKARLAAEDAFRQHPVIEKYPDKHAGAPISNKKLASKNESYAKMLNNKHNPWAPFSSQIDWEVARWAKLRGPGSTALSDLLKIDGVSAILQLNHISLIYILLKVCEKLELSYKNSNELNRIIDTKLPNRPKFHRSEVVIAGEVFEMYSRNIVDCIKLLFGDPEFTSQLILAPERHYVDVDKTQRIYHEMNTGKWWWSTQVSIKIFLFLRLC